MKKNKILLVVLALLVTALIAVFVLFVSPLLTESSEEEPTADTSQGETLGALGKYMIYPKLDRTNISKILVHNMDGEYAFVRDKSGNFVIEGLEDLPYNQKYFSALVAIVGNPLALTKVSSDNSGYAEYGLEDSENYWIVTATDGKEYKMTVGYEILTDGGYYVAYDGRDAVYVLGGNLNTALGLEDDGSTSLDVTVLKPLEFYVNPILIAGIEQDYYYETDNFTVYKKSEKFIQTKVVPKAEQVNPDALAESILTYPSEYPINEDYYYTILQNMVSLVGTSCAKAGATEQDYKAYGLADPEFAISFENDGKQYTLVAGAPLGDGTRYVASNLNPLVIAKIGDDMLGFLDDELISWLSPSPYNYDITSVKNMDIVGDGVDLHFDFHHGKDEEGKAVLALGAKNNLTGETKTIASADETWNFRSFYRTVLYTTIEANAPLTEAEKEALVENDGACVLRLSYTLSTGTKRTLEFRQYSTRRTLLTVNGEGEYYVYIDRVNKILSDAMKAYNGETVDSHAKN